jgi:hypothetical protein
MKPLLTTACLFLLFWACPVPPAAGEPPLPEPAAIPSLLSAVRVEGPLDFCGEPVPLEDPDVRERLEKEMLLALWDRAQVILWIKRTGRYFPHLEKVLAEKGLPDDLKYVAVVESALRDDAGSHKGAVGFWQFLSSTGRRYGLAVDRHFDERRSLHRSTEAATRYFEKLYAEFGSWTLSAAAYNMGEQGLRTEIAEQEVSRYYRLYLPEETQRFVFKILAAKRILSAPGRYGFDVEPRDLYRPVPFDEVALRLQRPTGIRDLARAAGTDYKGIKDLNPQLRGRYLPRGTHRLLVPPGKGEGLALRLEKAIQERTGESRRKTYVVREGDNLTAIASRFDVPLPLLLRWNGLQADRPIHPGQRLVIPSD